MIKMLMFPVKKVTNMRKEMNFSTGMYAIKKQIRNEKYIVKNKQ